jgi:Na+/H+ antiporter NhaC
VNTFAIVAVIFGCCFGAAVAGMVLHTRVPDHHTDGNSRDVVKLVMGLIATMAALVLSLLIASANSSYNTQASELEEASTNIVQFDRTLALYGPETRSIRIALKQAVIAVHERLWSLNGGAASPTDFSVTRDPTNEVYEALQALSPQTESQHRLQSAALQILTELSRIRTLMIEQRTAPIPWVLLTALVFWATALFLGFGMFVRGNATVIVALFVGALSVTGAIFLVLELNQPYAGVMHLSDAPMRRVLSSLGQ